MYLWTLCKQVWVTVSLLKTLTQNLKKKTEMGTIFVIQLRHQYLQVNTNKQCCLFNVQRVTRSFSAHNLQEIMCILETCMLNCPCDYVLHLHACLLIIKNKITTPGESPTEWRQIARYCFSSYLIIKKFLNRYFTQCALPWCHKHNIFMERSFW